MAKHGGFGGMSGMDMNSLMKQAQKMQKQMQEQAAALEVKEFSAAAGGGAVKVTMTGARVVKSVEIDPDAVDPDDVEMLQDMIAAAVNEVLKQVDSESKAMLGSMAGGMGGLGF